MGARASLVDFQNQTHPMRPVNMVVSDPGHQVEKNRRDEFSHFLATHQSQFEVAGVFVEPTVDNDDGFTRRMTGI